MRNPISLRDRLIVALDVDSNSEARRIVKKLGETVTFYKVGLQLITGDHGFEMVRELTKEGKKVFLYMKMEDTPRTVESSVRNLATEGVQLFTLNGNGATARAATAGRNGREYPKFLQVTYLSSWDVNDLRETFHLPASNGLDLDDFVVRRAERILESGCDGVIASGTSVARLRKAYPGALIVSPGIRHEEGSADDHKRTLTPYDAIVAGADYLVVGRPIRNSSDPAGTARHIQAEIERALGAKPAESRDDGAANRMTLRTAAAH